MANTVTNVTIIEDTTNNELQAHWEWTNEEYKKHTTGFSVRWWYTNDLGTWYLLDEQTIDPSVRNSKVSIQQDAIRMWVVIKPNSSTYKNSKGNEVSYFTSDWSTRVEFNLKPNPLPTPSAAPSVLIFRDRPGVMLMSVTDIQTDDQKYDTFVKFQLKRDEDRIYNTASIPVVNNTARHESTLTVGHWYAVRYRIEQKNKSSNTTGPWKQRTSDWSAWTQNYPTVPQPVKSFDVETVKKYDDYYARISWVSPDKFLPEDEFTYTIEYTNIKDHFDVGDVSSITRNQSPADILINYPDQDGHNEWFFRVCVSNDQGSSKWSEAKSIMLGEAPDKPTTWSLSETAVAGEEVTVYWVHNSKDNSKMTKAELLFIIDGIEVTDTYTPDPSSEETVHRYTINQAWIRSGATIKWAVHTKGASNDWGDWSIVREITVYTLPEVQTTILEADPNGVVTSYPITIVANAIPEEQTALGYHVSIVSDSAYISADENGVPIVITDGTTVYSKYFDDVDNEYHVSITPADVILENNMRYYVRVEVAMNSGLSAVGYALLLPEWSDSIIEPNAEIGVDDTLVAVNIRPYCLDSNGNLAQNVLLSVYRIDHEGALVEIAKNVSNDGATFVTDPHPPLNYARYRIVALSQTNGSTAYYDLPSYPIYEKAVIIQWNDWEQSFLSEGSYDLDPQSTPAALLRLPYNIDVSDKNDMDVALVEYIGRKHPVSYYGTQIGSSATWNVEIDKTDIETLYALRRLSAWQGDVYVREPSGSGYWAHVSVSFSQTHCRLTIPVTLDIVRVEGGA